MMSSPHKNNRNKATELPGLKRKWTEKLKTVERRLWSMSPVQLAAADCFFTRSLSLSLLDLLNDWTLLSIGQWSRACVVTVVMTWRGVLYGRCVWGAGWGKGRGWAGCPAAGGGHWAPRQASCPPFDHPCHQERHPLHQGGTWRKDRENRVTMRSSV